MGTLRATAKWNSSVLPERSRSQQQANENTSRIPRRATWRQEDFKLSLELMDGSIVRIDAEDDRHGPRPATKRSTSHASFSGEAAPAEPRARVHAEQPALAPVATQAPAGARRTAGLPPGISSPGSGLRAAPAGRPGTRGCGPGDSRRAWAKRPRGSTLGPDRPGAHPPAASRPRDRPGCDRGGRSPRRWRRRDRTRGGAPPGSCARTRADSSGASGHGTIPVTSERLERSSAQRGVATTCTRAMRKRRRSARAAGATAKRSTRFWAPTRRISRVPSSDSPKLSAPPRARRPGRIARGAGRAGRARAASAPSASRAGGRRPTVGSAPHAGAEPGRLGGGSSSSRKRSAQ